MLLGTDHLSTVSEDPKSVHASINSGRPLRLAAPHSAALADIDRLAEDVLGKQAGRRKTGNHEGLFGRIADALGIS